MTNTINFRPNHFRASVPPDEARELFRLSVQYVEIEPFSFCNRKCHFCPNATMPARQDRENNQFMPEPLFISIIDELSLIDYAGQIQLGRYEEPLSDRIILKRIHQIKDRLQKSWVYLHTNGDYLTPAYLDELRDAGLNGLAIQSYLGNGQRYDEAAMLARQQQMLRRLGLRIRKPIAAAPGLRHYHELHYDGMLVTLDGRNFDAIGTDRGGLVQIRKHVRTAPCLIPFTALYIDHDGSVMPCCNLRSDRPEHAGYVACRLQDGHTIFDAYTALHGWRRSLMRFGPKAAPCATCRYDEDRVPQSAAVELEQIYSSIENASRS